MCSDMIRKPLDLASPLENLPEFTRLLKVIFDNLRCEQGNLANYSSWATLGGPRRMVRNEERTTKLSANGTSR